ncbi:MAG: hypothetical protein CVV27_02915 [Candidatus Melainabacteria bacterium HGW-Melainabacteria-1]|nr:MAG: hypothetical protein CVV27_02915 [Candidatus Melainabacteria bacterium HGW-Melainabacteria-1]
MPYLRWIFVTTTLTALFTSGGLWLEQRLRGEPTAVAKPHLSEPASTPLQVLITGAVAQPGLYRLPAGSPVQALLSLAGGPQPDARLSDLDLSRPLKPGEVLYIASTAAAESDGAESVETDADPARFERAAKPSRHPKSKMSDSKSPRTKQTKATGPKKSAPLKLNQANVSELDRLPGVGPALAQRIVDWRREHGPFASLDDLLQVKGIGEKKLAKLKGQIRL